jgi:hypothetical protein
MVAGVHRAPRKRLGAVEQREHLSALGSLRPSAAFAVVMSFVLALQLLAKRVFSTLP